MISLFVGGHMNKQLIFYNFFRTMEYVILALKYQS